ncbi:MAG: hypothetical protein K0U37_03990 [Gammaproteobacteria bacterium]|nr:hypothetical protein [Gammaproteobacteria bacterium]
MKNILFGLLLMSCSEVYAEQLMHFDDIRTSILNGNNIRLVIDFSACSPRIDDLVIYTTPHDIALRKDHLEFADVPYITDVSNETSAAVDFESVTYKLTNTNELQFQFKSIALTGQNVSVNESSAVCPLDTAVKVFN